jgi:DNA replication protein
MSPMQRFKGFPAGKNGTTPVPTPFFSTLLPLIDDLTELKLTVYCFWALQQREGYYRYVRLCDLLEDKSFLAGLDADPVKAEQALRRALEQATERGTLLHVVIPAPEADEHLYFMNTERGRKAVAALEKGDWTPGKSAHQPIGTISERPNVFALYEQNVGPLTPMLSDILRDAENTYPASWIAEAMQIAVENNKRSWRYIEAILKRWTTEGKPGKFPQPAESENPYLRDEYFRRRGEKTE